MKKILQISMIALASMFSLPTFTADAKRIEEQQVLQLLDNIGTNAEYMSDKDSEHLAQALRSAYRGDLKEAYHEIKSLSLNPLDYAKGLSENVRAKISSAKK